MSRPLSMVLMYQKSRIKKRTQQLRSASIVPGFLRSAPESALVTFGNTKVICAATVEDRVPPFLRGQAKGWVTAEYGMLPRSSPERIDRGQARGGRALEISRLIGRSLRAAVDLGSLGERTVTIDCDVLQADGGTRTASITGGWVALALAIRRLLDQGKIEADPLERQVAALSIGIVDGGYALDLDYSRDCRAEVDLNLVAARPGGIIEVQGTAEHGSFTTNQLKSMVEIGLDGLDRLFRLQRKAVPWWKARP